MEPNHALAGRVALVTGAGRGIGRALAVGLANHGAAIAAVSRTAAELESLAAEVTASGGRIVAVPADLTDRAALGGLVPQTVDAFGGIDILVNNAGIGTFASPKPVAEFDDAFWDFSLALNLTAPYLLAKAAMPRFIQQSRGRIINIASIASRIGLMHGAAYAASKHGLLGLTRTLAIEGAKQGVTANAICPGPVKTAMNEARVQYDAERLGISVAELETRLTPIGRRLQPEEIVPLALLLASDGASAITGQAFNVCGGMHMA